MRALISRRPQPTSTRSLLCLLSLLFVVDGGGARTLLTPDVLQEPVAQLDTGTKLSAVDSESSSTLTSNTETGTSGQSNDDIEGTTIILDPPGNAEDEYSDLRDIDLVYDPDESSGKSGSSLAKFVEQKVMKKRRRTDVASKSDVREILGATAERIEEVKDEGIRRFDGQVDADGAVPYQDNVPDVPTNDARQLVNSEQFQKNWIRSVPKEEGASSGQVDRGEGNVLEESKEQAPSVLGKTAAVEPDQKKENVVDGDGNVHRGDRYLNDPQDKSRRKSSTVYLNAEEKKTSVGEQQSIVDGQIKKLISIRNDALDAQKVDNLDQAKVLTSKLQTGLDEAAITQENVHLEQGNKVMTTNPFRGRQTLGNWEPLKTWKEQAVALQDQIRNKTFLLRLREQVAEVLPGIPKFTEDQLLDALEEIAADKRADLSNTSYVGNLKDLGLTEVQLRIFRCAEQVLAVRERQSFVSNVVQCVQGLSVLNCIRIFVWPIVVDNVQGSLYHNYNLPIEINVFDLFQGNRPKSGRARNLYYPIRLVGPESVVYNILQNALEYYPADQTLVSYFDPKNETWKDLLTTDQLNILLMGEKLLPETLREEYSDIMFSCLRRFEYFSCVKFFAWPMIKQAFPALPAFPDYQTWYPVIEYYPHYPIVPFPSLPGDVGQLPEVVDADGTRSRRPIPEQIIIHVLQKMVKEQPQFSTTPSFIDQGSYVGLLPHDQLLTINVAEQLIPIAYRQQFVRNNVQCMKQYNYLTCIKYCTWPTVRQFIPNLPDITAILPDWQIPGWPDLQIPGWPDFIDWQNVPSFGSYWPFGSSTEKPETSTVTLLKNPPDPSRPATQQEEDMFHTLLTFYGDKIFSNTPSIEIIDSKKMWRFTVLQDLIMDVAQRLMPLVARKPFIDDVVLFLQRNDDFDECARKVILPTLALYNPDLPEFPSLEKKESDPKETAVNLGVQMQGQMVPEGERENVIANRFQDEESRSKIQQNAPVISVTGTRFVPIFTEHPENVILNIVRSVQLQSQNLNRASEVPATKNQQFLDLITEQQINIVNTVDSLLPESIRTNFTSKLIACLRVNNFLVCSRDVIWPTLSSYFPWLPSFPNFGNLGSAPSNATAPSDGARLNLTEVNSNTNAPPLSETDVKTGQQGDTKVTITDTRFIPIFNEGAESVILKILKAVELSVSDLKPSTISENLPQSGIVQEFEILKVAQNLVPDSARDSYIQRIDTCLKDKVFLQCIRDIAWPTINEAYPWLPKFPNFGSRQNMRRASMYMILPDDLALKQAEERIESVLLYSLNRDRKLERAYMDISNRSLSHLTKRQQNIVKLVELGIPDAARASYITRIQDCTKKHNFVTCTENISWPTLKPYLPVLPDFSEISVLLPQLEPNIPSIPLDPLPAPDLPIETIPGIPELPTGLPPGLSQLPFVQHAPGLASQLGQLYQKQGSSAFTPSVDNKGAVPGYAGQPPGILVDVSKERVQLRDVVQATKDSEIKRRERRSVVDLTNTYYESDGTAGSSDSSSAYPNNESEYLRLLISMREKGKASSEPISYYADTLNATVRKSLTADQYEIIKIVEEVDPVQGRGIVQQVVNCIAGLSFIRCVGIFVWPMIVSQIPLLGFFGRSLDTESQVQEFFGMSTTDFEKKMLERRDSIEQYLLDWYKEIVEDKFQTSLGCLKIKGYGNGELGISFSKFRKGRGAKLKDNKNLPSILTIISDIMEEVLDQRPEGEKPKRDKEKREKSIDVSREGEIQFLKDSEEYVDIMRSMNDEEIITMFLDKIRTNDSDLEDGGKFFGYEDAYKAFEVLFGPRLIHKLQRVNDKLRNVEEPSEEGSKGVDILSLESQKSSEELKVLPLGSQVTYDLEKESSRDQEQRQRQKRAKSFFKSFWDKHSSKHEKDELKQMFEEIETNKIVDDRQEKDTESGMVVKLPKLDEEFLPKKITNSVIHLGRAMKDKMMQMMPGLGLVFSFLLQMAVAHAKAAASMAGMISNMAMGSAIIGMVRDSFFGANSHPQIKYVYDNHKVGPGITWPANYGSGSHYRGH